MVWLKNISLTIFTLRASISKLTTHLISSRASASATASPSSPFPFPLSPDSRSQSPGVSCLAALAIINDQVGSITLSSPDLSAHQNHRYLYRPQHLHLDLQDLLSAVLELHLDQGRRGWFLWHRSFAAEILAAIPGYWNARPAHLEDIANHLGFVLVRPLYMEIVEYRRVS